MGSIFTFLLERTIAKGKMAATTLHEPHDRFYFQAILPEVLFSGFKKKLKCGDLLPLAIQQRFISSIVQPYLASSLYKLGVIAKLLTLCGWIFVRLVGWFGFSFDLLSLLG